MWLMGQDGRSPRHLRRLLTPLPLHSTLQATVVLSAPDTAYSHDPRKPILEPPALIAGQAASLVTAVQVSSRPTVCVSHPNPCTAPATPPQAPAQGLHTCAVTGASGGLPRSVCLHSLPRLHVHSPLTLTPSRAPPNPTLQARNNARVVVAGSVAMFTDALVNAQFTLPGEARWAGLERGADGRMACWLCSVGTVTAASGAPPALPVPKVCNGCTATAYPARTTRHATHGSLGVDRPASCAALSALAISWLARPVPPAAPPRPQRARLRQPGLHGRARAVDLPGGSLFRHSRYMCALHAARSRGQPRTPAEEAPASVRGPWPGFPLVANGGPHK
jgi:hypothetical protein